MVARDSDLTPQPVPAGDLLPPVARFVATVRKYISSGYADSALWSRVAGDLASLTADPELRRHAADWPVTHRERGKPTNLLFYQDPDYGFVLNAQVLAPGACTNAHDHGASWNLYAVIEGGEKIEHFIRRRDMPKDGDLDSLEPIGIYDAKPGFVDIVPPGHFHRKTNGDHRSVNLIVRSFHAHTFRRYHFDADTGRHEEYHGPAQIPYAMA